MNYRLIIIVGIILFPNVAHAGAVSELLNVFFSPLWNLMVSSTCTLISDNFDDGYRLGCTCHGLFNDNMGLGGELICVNDDNYCLVNNPAQLYCGSVALKVGFSAKQGATELVGCMDVKSNLPESLVGDLPPVCATVIPTGNNFKFESCSIQWGADQKCASCSICENERDFTFNCSNINVNPVGEPFVAGPALTTCEGFGFLGGL